MNADQSKSAENDRQTLGSEVHEQEKGNEKLHIFINKIKFDGTQGVKSQMTGGELADASPKHERRAMG